MSAKTAGKQAKSGAEASARGATNDDLAATLARAEGALAKGDRRAALSALLAAWRTRRLAEIEPVIEVLSADLARAHAAIAAPAKELDAVFGARAQAHDETELPRLLEALTADPKGTLPLRLRALFDAPADPRLGQKLLAMIDEPPITSSSNFPMWTALFAALPSYVDARAEPRLRARATSSGGASKFWPKLTAWIEKALPLLPPTPTATSDERARLAAMKKSAEALAKESPTAAGATPAKKATAAPTATTETTATAVKSTAAASGVAERTPRALLADALAALDPADPKAADPAAALAALTAFWAERRAPAVAEIVESLGRVVDVGRPSLAVGKPAELHAAWLKLGRAPEAADVERLLAALTAGKLVDAEERLTYVAQWPPDPRVGRRLALFFEDYLLGARPVMWKLIYDALVHHADPRQQELIVGRADQMENRAAFDRVRSERTQLRRIRGAFVAACERPTSLAVDEADLVAKIAAATTRLSEARAAAADEAGRDERALVRAIADAMDDDAPRAVYADLLTGRGDPRGEFLAMALADASGRAKLKSKLAAFEKTHRGDLHGPLDSLIYKAETGRGLLEHVGITDKAFDWNDAANAERVLSDLRWCTVRTLDFPLSSTGRRAQREILGRAPLFGLRELRSVTWDELAVLAARGAWPNLSVVTFQTYRAHETKRDDTWAILERAELPGLARVVLSGFEVPPGELLRSASMRRLQRLEAGAQFVGGQPDLAAWLKALEAARFPVPDVHVTNYLVTLEWHGGPASTTPLTLRFHRDVAQGPKDSAWNELVANLVALAGTPGGFEWTAAPGVDLCAPLVAKLDELGARRGIAPAAPTSVAAPARGRR